MRPDSALQRPTIAEINAAVAAVSASSGFVSSPRLERFLRYIVEQTLAGNGDQLQEAVIGLEVYDRGPNYDPKADSIVRVEARRLRKALAEYYAAEGQNDRVVIEVPKGRYVPEFHRQRGRTLAWNWKRYAAALAILTAALIGAWRMSDTTSRTVERTPRQITADTGLSAWPEISADGNLIVYSSDRDGGPDLDLWLRYVDRDETIQLTDEPGDEIGPDHRLMVLWSPTRPCRK